MRRATLAARGSALAALTVLLLTASACGGGGSPEDAEKKVREFTEAVSSGDPDKLCKDILSTSAREAVAGSAGENAEDQCIESLSGARRPEVNIRRIVSTATEGERATVVAEIEEGQTTRRQVYELEKDDGEFRIAEFR